MPPKRQDNRKHWTKNRKLWLRLLGLIGTLIVTLMVLRLFLMGGV